MKKIMCISFLTVMVLLSGRNSAMAQYDGDCDYSGGFYYCSAYSEDVNEPASHNQSWATSQTSFTYVYVNMIVDAPTNGYSYVSVSFGNYYWSKSILSGYFDDSFSASSGTSVSSIYLDTYAQGAESHISAGW